MGKDGFHQLGLVKLSADQVRGLYGARHSGVLRAISSLRAGDRRATPKQMWLSARCGPGDEEVRGNDAL
jgi:hypothetical protein